MALGGVGALLFLSLLFRPRARHPVGGQHRRIPLALYRVPAARPRRASRGLLLVFVFLALLPRGARRVVAALLCAIALVAWTYADFLAGGMTVLNGIDRPMDF